MLLPMSSLNLVVPSSAVSEIIGYSTPQKLDGSSDWFLGVVLWRGAYVPVVSLEVMCSLDSVHLGPRSRIGVIYNPEKDDDLPYIGLHMQDIPRAYLAESDSMESGNDVGISQYLLSTVDDEQFQRAIPNLDAMFAELKPQFNAEVVERLNQ